MRSPSIHHNASPLQKSVLSSKLPPPPCDPCAILLVRSMVNHAFITPINMVSTSRLRELYFLVHFHSDSDATTLGNEGRQWVTLWKRSLVGKLKSGINLSWFPYNRENPLKINCVWLRNTFAHIGKQKLDCVGSLHKWNCTLKGPLFGRISFHSNNGCCQRSRRGCILNGSFKLRLLSKKLTSSKKEPGTSTIFNSSLLKMAQSKSWVFHYTLWFSILVLVY